MEQTPVIVAKMENPVNDNLSEEEKKRIGARFLRAFKEALGIENKQEIADLMGYGGDKTIYKIADGRQELNFSKLVKFSAATGFSIHWLITGEGPPTIRRIDFKNLWSRIIQAWEREIEVSGDNSLRVELEAAKGMSQRNFLPDIKVVERVSIITHTPMLWLLTGEGAPRSEKPFDNQPVYIADLITDYKLKESLPLPFKSKLMSTEVFNGDYKVTQTEPAEGLEHSLSLAASSVGRELIERARSLIKEIVREELRQTGATLKFDSPEDEARLRASVPSDQRKRTDRGEKNA